MEAAAILNKSLPANYKRHIRNLVIILVFGAIGFSTIQDFLVFPYSGIESSWVVGLNMARIYGLQFGKDVVFPFGPLGFMYYPFFCEFNTWFISAVFCVFVHCLFIYSIIIMIKKLSICPRDCVLMGVVLMFALPVTRIEYELLFSVLMLLYLSIVSPYSTPHLLILYIFVSFMMAAASLIKFTAALIAVSIILFMTIFCLCRKRVTHLCCILFVYAVSILVLLAAAGQKIANFPAYLSNSCEIVRGYSAAMSLAGPGREICVGLYAVGLLIFLLLDSILKNKTGLKYFIFISLGFVLVNFKHGFVRHDASHIYIFFANTLLVFCSMYVAHKKQLSLLSRCLSLILIFVLIAFIFKGLPRQINPDIPRRLKMVSSAVSLATNNTAARAKILEDTKNKMKNAYPLSNETLEYIGGRPMDIMPWEISLPFAYNMKWSPRPVFQCYSAYTDELDMLNSQYFESVNAPDFLLYALGAIDGRYPLFDEPATFRTILRNYKPVFIDGRFIILKKTDANSSAPSETITVLDTELGKSIRVPKTKGGYLYAKIYMEYNLLGKIANLVYKSPNIFIGLITVDGNKFLHRFVFSTARNGIFLSQYISSLGDLFEVWNGRPNNNLDAIVIFAPNRYFYNRHIRVEFFEVPQKAGQAN
jgi:hypothetical protein